MNLAELQIQLEAALRGSPQSGASRILSQIIPAGRLTGADALNVYGNSYRARLTSALCEIYETVWQALGDEDFFAIADRYIAEHPSRTHSLQFYGAEFPVFLVERKVPEHVSEAARFDWKFAELFHKQTQTGLEGAELAAAVESGQAVSLVSSAFLFQSAFAVNRMFECRSSGEAPGDIARPVFLLVHKTGDSIWIQTLEEPAFKILESIQVGTPTAQALAESNAVEADVQTLFAYLASRRLLTLATWLS